ncbi:MAG: tetratricopeptide repeat protein, partial [Vicinamibacterales bacterium]
MLHQASVVALACVAVSCSRQAAAPPPAEPTFARDIAPIVYTQCATCHRPGEAGPFSLLTYADVRKRARQIAEVTGSRYMPPWMPEPGHGDFVGERRLTAAQIATIQRWVERGAPEGDARDLPAPPSFPHGWQLGTPDLTVEMPAPVAVPAEGLDQFRTVIVPVAIDGPKYVRAVEFRPGNARAVHHAMVRLVRAADGGPWTPDGEPRSAEGGKRIAESKERLAESGSRIPESGVRIADRGARTADGGSRIADRGYRVIESEAMLSTEEDIVSPDGHVIGWAPGYSPTVAPEGLAWRLEPGTALAIELHLQATGKVERVQATVGLFFTADAPARQPFGLQLGSYTIDIPPGAREYQVEDHYELPVDVDLYAIYPHAHYLGKELRAFATLPDGTERSLVWIRDWDFNWQNAYRYRTPPRLPRGTILRMRYTYDNSAENPRNPSRPPVRVRYGGRSVDEMGNLWMQVVPVNPGELAALRVDYDRTSAERQIAGFEAMRREHPASPGVPRALGTAYLRVGRVDEAIVALSAAARLAPRDVIVRYNLAHALASKGRTREAATQFREAARLQPAFAEAHNNLGALLRQSGDLAGAERAFRA